MDSAHRTCYSTGIMLAVSISNSEHIILKLIFTCFDIS